MNSETKKNVAMLLSRAYCAGDRDVSAERRLRGGELFGDAFVCYRNIKRTGQTRARSAMRSVAFSIAAGLAIFISFAVENALATSKRVALVVGNAAYEHTSKLRNPRNDASDIAAQLDKLGFEVLLATDQTKKKLEGTLVKFAGMLDGADTAVFFYAGHGLQASGINYLVPTDAKLDSPLALDFELVRLRLVQQMLENKASSNVIFLDACRDNPLARDLAQTMGTRSALLAQGLAPAESGVGTLISFATQPGNVAIDGKGRNSPYSGALIRHISMPNEDISSVLVNVRNDVMASTSNKQVPWEHSALSRKIIFNQKSLTRPTSDEQKENNVTDKSDPENELWTLVKATDDPALLQEYVRMFPQGRFIQSARQRLASLGDATAKVPGTGKSPAASSGNARNDREKQNDKRATLPTEDRATSLPTSVTTPDAEEPKAAATGQATKPYTGNLALDVQRELRRAQCYSGKLDGVWGSRSRVALRKALASTDAKAELTLETLEALRQLKADHCHVAAIQPAAGDKKTKKSKSSSGRKVTRRRPAATTKRPSKSTRKRASKRKPVVKSKSKSSRSGKTRRRAVARKKSKKNCKFQFNPEAHTDDKAPKGIVICD